MQESYARLHVLVARESDYAVVLRRGPSKQVCVLGWDRTNDTFKVGQWLKGRIYEERCDISPDGKHWVYFAMNGKWDSEAKGSWTAVARTPWLKALELWPQGDCWGGGGLFLDNKTYYAHTGDDLLFGSHEVQRDSAFEFPQNIDGEQTTSESYRRYRAGWVNQSRHHKTLLKEMKAHSLYDKVLTKNWKLEEYHLKSGARLFQLFNPAGEIMVQETWEWADWVDRAIVYADQGCLYRLKVKSRKKISEPELVHDFNHYQFERVQVPY